MGHAHNVHAQAGAAASTDGQWNTATATAWTIDICMEATQQGGCCRWSATHYTTQLRAFNVQ